MSKPRGLPGCSQIAGGPRAQVKPGLIISRDSRSAGFSPNRVKQPCSVWSLGRKLAWVDPCKRGRDLGFSVGVESRLGSSPWAHILERLNGALAGGEQNRGQVFRQGWLLPSLLPRNTEPRVGVRAEEGVRLKRHHAFPICWGRDGTRGGSGVHQWSWLISFRNEMPSR